MFLAIKSKKLPSTKADQNTCVTWQLSWLKPNGKLLAEN